MYGYEHPMAGYSNQMGASLWDQFTTGIKNTISTETSKLPGELQAGVVKAILNDPKTQQALIDQANQQAVQASASQIVNLQQQTAALQARLSKTIPGGLWTVLGVGVAAVVAYRMLK